MQLDLSSKITLERIPERYYRATNAIEKSDKHNLKKIDTEIFDSEVEGSAYIAREIATIIRKKQEQNQTCVLGLSGGSSPLGYMPNL